MRVAETALFGARRTLRHVHEGLAPEIEARLAAVRLDGLRLVTVPGELLTANAAEIAREAGDGNLVVVGYANGSAVGLHARPAAQFVKTANRFRARITLDLAGRTAGAKSVLSVLGLQAGRGTSVAVCVEGDDADAAAAALRELVGSNFGEAA